MKYTEKEMTETKDVRKSIKLEALNEKLNQLQIEKSVLKTDFFDDEISHLQWEIEEIEGGKA